MNLSNKKILNLTLGGENFNLIKKGEKKTDFREYNKHWKQKFEYPCGTVKSYDFVLIENEEKTNSPQLLVEFKGIKTVKEKKGWFGTQRFFVIEMGKVLEEIS